MKRFTTVLFSFVAASGMAACSGSSGTPLDDYIERLGRSLDEPIVAADVSVPALPRARDLKIDLLPGSLDLLDMLTLSDCRLNITIGKSNSSLGKLATASQRLLLELEFLALAPECIASLDAEDDGELIATLQTAVAEKQQQLPARIWNATLAGPEFRRFWQSPVRLGDYPADTSGSVPTALSRLIQLTEAWLDGNYAEGIEELEPLLGDIRRGDGGALLRSLALQQGALSAASPAVRARIERPLCFGHAPSPEGEIVNSVVHKYFAAEVQAWSVKLARRRQDLLTPVAELEHQLAQVSTPAYQSWREQRDLLLTISAAAPRTHAEELAELLDSCGLRPGGDLPNSSEQG